MQKGELGAPLERGAPMPATASTVTLDATTLDHSTVASPPFDGAPFGGAPFDGAPFDGTASGGTASGGVALEDTNEVMGRRRRAVIVGLAVLAVLQAADVLATWALLANDGAELNPVGRALIGSGGAIFVKLAIIAALFALVLSKPLVRMGFVCGVWAVTGIYLAVVAMNLYSLHLVGGLG